MTETMDPTLLGARPRRLDAEEKVTGRARYASDFTAPGMLFGKIVRSDRPHARILGIDASAALALPGVEAALFGDVTGGRFGDAVKDQTPFALEKVRYIGDPVAAIAAETAEIAEQAARLLEVDYEDLPAVFDPVAALEPDAPLVHDDIAGYAGPSELIRYGNVAAEIGLTRGDISAAFAAADRIVEGAYTTHSAHQMPMETRATVAEVDARGRLTFHSSTQGPFTVRQQLHEALRMPYSDLRVIAETVGGGFGAKLEASVEMYAGMLARATGRPVKVVNSREDDLSAGNPRHPMQFHIQSALTADGTLLGREITIIMDAGAYSGGTPLLAGLAALLAPGPYRLPNLHVKVLAVHTNSMSYSAYRGPTGPQAVFAVESHTDAIARELGLDPVQFRLKNILTDGDTGHTGQPLPSVSLRETLLKAAEAIEWGRENPPSDPGLKRGKGIAVAWWLTSAGNAGCNVQFDEDGTVIVQTGASEIGTGSVMSGIAQIVAAELGVGLEKVRIVWGDTAATPMDGGASGSRTLFNAGHAARNAAISARGELLRRAAEILEASEADLEIVSGRIRVRGVPDRGVEIAELTGGQMWTSQPIIGTGTYMMPATAHDPGTLKGSIFTAFNAPSFHCHAAEVEVDPETGSTRVVDYVAVQDVGFAVAPAMVEGQMQGGAVQGVGYALMEQVVLEEGRMLNPNLALYKIPTTLEAPAVRTVMVESASEHGPYGAKGVGEPPVVPPAGAIANAVTQAIGRAVTATPLTPERVLRTIRDA